MTANILPMDVETVDTHTITRFPGNPRIGNREAIKRSLQEHGQYKPLIVQKSTGHIIAGNNTFTVATEDLDWTRIAVQYVDVTDERAKKISVADNRTNDLATYDDRLLAEFLSDLDDLDGTGYDPGDLEALTTSLNPPDLDDIAADIGTPKNDDGWPSITMRVPHSIKAAWNSHLSTHSDDTAQAMADLLGIDYTPER